MIERVDRTAVTLAGRSALDARAQAREATNGFGPQQMSTAHKHADSLGSG